MSNKTKAYLEKCIVIELAAKGFGQLYLIHRSDPMPSGYKKRLTIRGRNVINEGRLSARHHEYPLYYKVFGNDATPAN